MSSTIAKYIERFRYQEPLPSAQRHQFPEENSRKAFWWLEEEPFGSSKPLTSETHSDDDESISSEDSLNNTHPVTLQKHPPAARDDRSDLQFSYSNLYLLNSHETTDSNLTGPFPPPQSSSVIVSSFQTNVDSLEVKVGHSQEHERSFSRLDDKTQELFSLCDRLLEDFQQESLGPRKRSPIHPMNVDVSPSSHSSDTFEKGHIEEEKEEEEEAIDLRSSLNSTLHSSLAIDRFADVESSILKGLNTSVLDHPSLLPEQGDNGVRSDDGPVPTSQQPGPTTVNRVVPDLTSSLYLSSDDEENFPSVRQKYSTAATVPQSTFQMKEEVEAPWSFETIEEYLSDDIVLQLYQQYEAKQKEVKRLRERLRQLTS